MGSFTELFQNTPLEQRPELIDTERQRRVTEHPDHYVSVPVIVPKMSSVVQGHVADYELFWLIGLPGPIDHPKFPDKKAREAINFQCSKEDTAEDMCWMLNFAQQHRKMVQKELEGERQPVGGCEQHHTQEALAQIKAQIDNDDDDEIGHAGPGCIEDALTGK